MIKRLRKNWEIFIIILFGLTPLLWFREEGFLVLGHDTGFPLEPVGHFLDRLFIWTKRLGFGYNQTQSLGGFFIHGFEAVLAVLDFSLQDIQKITFSFWLIVPGLSMYLLLKIIHPESKYRFLRFFGSLFYMFNHFLLQGWFIAERTKFSLVAAQPILLLLTILAIQKKLKASTAAVLFGLTAFFFNGGGSVPLYGGILLTLTLGFLFFGLSQTKTEKKQTLKHLTSILLRFITAFILFNSFWLWPLLRQAVTAYKIGLSLSGGLPGVLAWIQEISKNTSIINVIRLQGIPDWYDNQPHPFSSTFLKHPLFIMASFIMPLLAFFPLFFKKTRTKPYVLFFSLLALVSLVFVAGSHPPFGFLYSALISIVPGMALFRSPFYKFAPALWLSYAYLVSFSLCLFIERFSLKRIFKIVIYTAIVLLYLGYNYPFFTGSFFLWNKPFTTRVNPPDYIFSFNQWLKNNTSSMDRFLAIPPLDPNWQAEVYTWNYWSLAPLTSLINRHSIIENERVLNSDEQQLIEDTYYLFLRNVSSLAKMLKFLGINHFLLRDDLISKAGDKTMWSVSAFREKVAQLPQSFKIQDLGPWSIYRYGVDKQPILKVSNRLPLIISQNRELDPTIRFERIVSLEELNGDGFYLTDLGKYDRERNLPVDTFNKIFVIGDCQDCRESKSIFQLTLPVPKIYLLPHSLFYPLVSLKEAWQQRRIQKELEIIDSNLGLTIKRLAEVKRMIELRESPQDIIEGVKGYTAQVEKIGEYLSKANRQDKETQRLILRINTFLKEENKILALLKDQSEDPQVKTQFRQVNKQLSKFYQVNRPFEYQYPPKDVLRYTFNPPKSGRYTIFLEDIGFLDNSFTLNLDGALATVSAETRIDGFRRLGAVEIKAGFAQIEILVPPLLPLLSQKDPKLTLPGEDCQVYTVEAQANKLYTVSFDYRTEKGRGPFLSLFEERHLGSPIVTELILEGEPTWQEVNLNIHSSVNTKDIGMSLCHQPGFEDQSLFLIRNIVISDATTPLAILYNEQEKNLTLQPSLSLLAQNQTDYQIKMDNSTPSFFLLFLERFDPSWKLLVDGKMIEEKAHFKANGFANGWLINGEKGRLKEMRLIYTPQRFFYQGAVVSLLTLLFSLAYILFKVFKLVRRHIRLTQSSTLL